jgi:cell division protein FtsQ
MLFASRKRNRRKAEETKRKWSLDALKVRLQGTFRPLLMLAAFGGGAALLFSGLLWSFDRPIGKVEVDGKFQRVAPVQIEAAIADFRGQGFLSVDLDAMRAALETLPWVDRARAERRWPNTVRIHITEHVPAARWGIAGLMNTRGELFLTNAERIPPELPQLNGPLGTEQQVATLYLETYPRLLEVGMRLARVELDPRGAWSLTLDNGIEVRLGRQDVNARLERFIRDASSIVAARGAEVGYVDLRYSNGFAVGWNSAPARVAHDTDGASPDV